MTRLVDLDKLISPDIRVRLGGHTYTLPGDLPADLYLEINARAADDSANEYEGIADLHEKVLGLFRYKQPDLQSIPGLSLRQLLQAVGTIYGSDDADVDEDDVPPPRRSSSGGATRSGQKTTRTRPRR